jgi:hypothetical protein
MVCRSHALVEVETNVASQEQPHRIVQVIGNVVPQFPLRKINWRAVLDGERIRSSIDHARRVAAGRAEGNSWDRDTVTRFERVLGNGRYRSLVFLQFVNGGWMAIPSFALAYNENVAPHPKYRQWRAQIETLWKERQAAAERGEVPVACARLDSSGDPCSEGSDCQDRRERLLHPR